jgi:hypothetical protein
MRKSAPGPIRDEPPTGGPICRRCKTGHALGADRCATCGSALAGNRLAHKHGAFGRADRPELASMRLSAETWTADVRASQGGIELAPVRDGAIVNLGSLEFLKRLLIEDLQTNGLHTRSKKGGPPRVRSSFALLLQVLDRWSRYAVLLGLDARRSDVIQSPREWLEGLPDRQSNDHPEDQDHAEDEDTAEHDAERADAGELDSEPPRARS